MRAFVALRHDKHYRLDAFMSGLKRAGYRVQASHWNRPEPGDVLVIWNRYGQGDGCARLFEKRGGTVLVAENGYTGKDAKGGPWYALSKWQHNGAGEWVVGGPERWRGFGMELAPWRDGKEYVVLPQRGIGPHGVAMPRNWHKQLALPVPYRVRPHPGQGEAVPLAEDLAKAKAVVTWGSGAAIKALMLGVPVFYDFRRWIGAGAGLPLSRVGSEPLRCDFARLRMFERLAWAQWRISEISSGEAFTTLLSGSNSS